VWNLKSRKCVATSDGLLVIHSLIENATLIQFSGTVATLQAAILDVHFHICNQQLQFIYTDEELVTLCFGFGQIQNLGPPYKFMYYTNRVRPLRGTQSLLVVNMRRYSRPQISPPNHLTHFDETLYPRFALNWWVNVHLEDRNEMGR
jgi:hypothetical protein